MKPDNTAGDSNIPYGVVKNLSSAPAESMTHPNIFRSFPVLSVD